MSTLSDLWPKWSVFECVKTSLSTIQQIINVSDGLLSGQVFEVPLLQAEKIHHVMPQICSQSVYKPPLQQTHLWQLVARMWSYSGLEYCRRSPEKKMKAPRLGSDRPCTTWISTANTASCSLYCSYKENQKKPPKTKHSSLNRCCGQNNKDCPVRSYQGLPEI